jgi:hypothetical protein
VLTKNYPNSKFLNPNGPDGAWWKFWSKK